jgi:hypothetical protein
MIAHIRVFLVWLISFILTAVILALGYQVVMNFIVKTLGWDRYDARFTHLLYYTLVGIVWLFIFILNYDYLNRMAEKGRLLFGTLRTIGTELAVIAAMQIILTLYRYFPADWLNIGLIILDDDGLATTMLYFARKKT